MGDSDSHLQVRWVYNNNMNTYIIGDLQGCFDTLQSLLEKINFNPSTDRLGFVGDLVNRGAHSLKTLRFIAKLQHPIVVLGNHDLHLIALYFKVAKSDDRHTLDQVLKAPDCDYLIDWLLQQPFLYQDPNNQFVITHAGIPPQWSIKQAAILADSASSALKADPKIFLQQMYGDKPDCWQDYLTGWDRMRYIVNAFTRMRFCDANGRLDLVAKNISIDKEGYKPWFKWQRHDQTQLYFGHWASLEGKCDAPNVTALDTGCLWGGKLTAINTESGKLFAVEKSATDGVADY